MEYTKAITLDVSAENNLKFVKAKQGDKVLRKLEISLVSDGVAYAPDAASATFRCAKPDNTAVVISGITGSSGVYTVTLTEQCLAVAGRCLCDLALLDSSGNVLSTADFTLDVIPMPDIGNIIASSTEWIELQEAIDAAEKFADILAFQVSNGYIQYTVDGSTWVDLCPLTDIVGDLEDRVEDIEYDSETVTDEIVTWDSAVEGVPLRQCIVNIEPYQSGSGDPSPTNVRAISGWTEANVYATGKNLLPQDYVTTTLDGITYTVNSDGTITATGTRVGSETANFPLLNLTENLYPFVIGETYKLSGCQSGGSESTYFLRMICYSGSTILAAATDTGSGGTITIPSGTNHIIVFVNQSSSGLTITFSPMIVHSDVTDSTYEAFGEIINVDLSDAGTVYGGTLNVLTGELTVDRVKVSFDGSADEVWNLITASVTLATYQVVLDSKMNYPDGSYPPPLISNIGLPLAQSATFSDYTDCRISARVGGTHIMFIYKGVSDELNETEFRDWLSNNNLDVVYELATPLTYQLTPNEIKCLLGENNVWSDAGEVTVEYGAYLESIVEYVDRNIEDLQETAESLETDETATRVMIAGTESTSTASQAYSAGEYLIYNDILYKVTTAIASGGTLMAGTNISQVSIGDELSDLKSALNALCIADYDSTDESISYVSAEYASYDSSDESIAINI